jgi:3-phosphoshikimate 1-carboxyvinyltransferase
LLGLEVAHQDAGKLVLTGVGRSLIRPVAPISTAGSAFNFRTVAALACLVPGETIIEGNASMRARPVLRHLNFMHDLGARFEDISDAERLRIRVHGGTRLGGRTTIDTEHSSQALTAALLMAPLADQPVRIDCDQSGLVGEGYIDLTVAMMREQGARVTHAGSGFDVLPSVYQSRLHMITSDFTALSYLAGAVAVTEAGELSVTDYQPSTLSSETEFLAVLRELGVRTVHDPITRTLRISRVSPQARTIEVDGRNIPTVVPTLAAIAPFIDGRIIVRNVAHVDNHKCRRVSVMLRELTRLGCRLRPLYRADARLDGFATEGRQRPAGGGTLDSHGDHRIFMSLAVAALGARTSTAVAGAELLRASFPDFLETLTGIGAEWQHAGAGMAPAADAIPIESGR